MILVLNIILLLTLVVGPFVWAMRQQAVDEGEADLSVFRDQLTELQADHAVGLIDEKTFLETEVELKRRLLSAADGIEKPKKPRHVRYAALLGILFVGVVPLYFYLGEPRDLTAPLYQGAAQESEIDDLGTAELDALLQQLRDHLKTDPQSVEGWLLFGRTLAGMGEIGAAANAYAEGAEANPTNVELRVRLGEALTFLADGLVTPAARLAFLSVETLSPDHPAALYYIGLYLFQNGKVSAAEKIWTRLQEVSPPDAPWLAAVEAQLARAAASLSSSADGSGPMALDPAQMAAVAQMTPAEQRAFIEGMILNLEGRLQDNPNDLEGWLRLAQVKAVMGDFSGAVGALIRAEALADDAQLADIQAQRAAFEAEIARTDTP